MKRKLENFMKHLFAITVLCVTPALVGPFEQPYSIIETDTMLLASGAR